MEGISGCAPLGLAGILEIVLTHPALEWRNWQTHGTQNPAAFTGHESSTLSSSTNQFSKLDPSVNRAQGLTVTWTGGNPGTFVFIGGSFTVSLSSAKSPGLGVGYGCGSAVEAGQFTVPSYILHGFPAGSGATTVNQQVDLEFSATGLGAATSPLTGQIEFSQPTTYQ